DAPQAQRSQMFQQRLNRKKPDLCWSRLQMTNARHTMLYVFHANTPPDVWVLGDKVEFGFQQLCHTLGTLCENLECMPVCRRHHPADGDNVVVGNLLVEQV